MAELPPVSFNRDIRPIMSDTCFHCHGFDAKTREAGLRLDLREEAIKKTEEGTLPIVPGNPEMSAIIARIFDEEDPMPPEKAHKPFTPAQKELFRRWVAEGAVYEPHWAYAPLTKPTPPANAKHPIDAFIRARLTEKKITPSPAGAPLVLQRRLALDLTGLPPQGAASTTHEAQIETLLASPHYGERMAVWWLDIARFADTVGFHGDQNQRIFPYRDYVINAFNANKRFDQFTLEQLAGDLLPNPTTEQLIATGYNRLNMMTREGGAQAKEYLAKYGAERVRSVAAAWFGSTFGCAECHDHKFDPIKTRDFYELQSFFADVKQWGVYTYYGNTPEPELAGFSNESPFPPEIQVESPWLKKQHTQTKQKLEAHLKATSERLATDSKAVTAQAAWESTLAPFLKDHANGWMELKPATSELQKDGKPLPIPAAKAGKTPTKRVPTVTAKQAVASDKALGKGESLQIAFDTTAAPTVAAIRLEVAQDEIKAKELESKLGKDLTLSLQVQPTKGKPIRLGLRIGEATAKRLVHRSGLEVPGLDSEWRLPKTHVHHQPLHAVWLLSAPVTLKPGERLIATLSGDNLLPIRFSASPLGATQPLEVALTDELKTLATPMPQRSLDQARQVTKTFLLSTAHDRPAYDAAHKLAADLRGLFEGRTWTLVTQPAVKPLTVRVLPRGNWQDETGPVVLPSSPSFLPGRIESTEAKRLTRLDLAKWIVSKDNPITARAVMNRLWAQFFGIGLSAVVDDLGSQGELPSHPELLDWLASEFRDSGWDMKHMIRLIVTSDTYRQSSNLRPELKDADPTNRLLASQNPRRLEAEFVRDNALSIAGLLNLEDIGGPSVKPYQPIGYYEALQFPNRDYIADIDSRQWRRGVYAHWQRTFLHPMMANFDAPARDECAAARTNSNTPQQALTLLNDPAFVEAARVFAARLLHEAPAANDETRLKRAYQLALNRDPKVKEVQSLQSLLKTQTAHFTANPADATKLLKIGLAPQTQLEPAKHAAWTQITRVLLNAHETLTRY
jgi:hypothetical protein